MLKPPSSRPIPLPPPLKWAGGKRWLVPSIRLLWETSGARRLVEPFAGGLSIALGLQPKIALINDVNPHLINFYKQIQKGLHLDALPENRAEDYYAARTEFNRLIEARKEATPEAARLFYYLNRAGFNGLCRFNNQGLFNVPFGDNKGIPTKDLTPYSELFGRWKFLNKDFADLAIESGDFVYADPPYDGTFTKYAHTDFSWQDQERLASWLSALPVAVVSSNQATERVLNLYHEASFCVLTAEAPRRISCDGDRSPALEMLAFKSLEAVSLPGFTPYAPPTLRPSPYAASLFPLSKDDLPSASSPASSPASSAESAPSPLSSLSPPSPVEPTSSLSSNAASTAQDATLPHAARSPSLDDLFRATLATLVQTTELLRQMQSSLLSLTTVFQAYLAADPREIKPPPPLFSLSEPSASSPPSSASEPPSLRTSPAAAASSSRSRKKPASLATPPSGETRPSKRPPQVVSSEPTPAKTKISHKAKGKNS